MTESSERSCGAAALGSESREAIHPLIDLYRRYERLMYRQCLGQLRNRADAEDAVQETFARAALHLDQLTEDPAPYLATVARNVCRDEMQRRARCISAGDPTLFGEIEVGHAETTSLDRDQLNKAWQVFTSRERQLIGRRFAGFSYDEIAGHLQMTPGALNLALARARKRARQVASVSLGGLLALLALPRLAGRWARPAGGSSAIPATLVAAAAVSCLAIGSGGWMRSWPGSHLPTAPSSTGGAAIGLRGPAAAALATGVPGLHTALPETSAWAPRPAPSSQPALGGLAASVISPGQNATQQDAVFTSVTPSPSYSRDRTVFASGSLADGCGRPSCPVLFRTQDGGASWQHLAAAGYAGGRLLLSPTFPADPVLFAVSPLGLQRSDDGGATFRTVVPGPAPAAVDPRSATGSTRVLIAAQVPVVYDAATGGLSAGPALPAGVTAPVDVAYLSGGEAVFSADRLDPAANTLQDGVIVACPASRPCSVTLVAPDRPVIDLAAPSAPSAPGAIVAWSSAWVAVSRDGAASFHDVALPGSAPIDSVTLGPGPSPVHLVVAQRSSVQGDDHLLQSPDGGASFAALSTPGQSFGHVGDAVLLPDGHELVALTQPPGEGSSFGIRCSSDGGSRWSATC